MESQYTDLIERFFDGQLTTEEKEQFNELKETNTDFQAEFSLFEKSQMAVELYALQQLKDNARQLDKASASKSTKPMFNWMKIAASILIIAVVSSFIYVQRSFSNAGLYTDSYSPVGDYISDLGSGKTPMDAALQLYNQKQYALAVDAFLEIENNEPENQVVKFYLGQSLLLNGQPDQGIRKLKEVIGDYQPEARWHAALALLKKNEEEKCASLLDDIIAADKDSTFVAKATKLKTKLNSPWRKWVIF